MTKDDPRHPVDVHVGARLRQLRKAAGLSQGTLAAQAGVTFQQVQKYERGTNRISASKLFEFAQTLEVSPMVFFEGLPVVAAGGGGDAQTGAAEGDQLASFGFDPLVLRAARQLAAVKDPATRKQLGSLIERLAKS